MDPDFELSERQRVELQTVLNMPGFEVLKVLALAEIARFDVALRNINPISPSYITELTNMHARSQAASMFWSGLVRRLNSELELGQPKKKSAPTAKDAEPDSTQELLEGTYGH